MLNATRMLAFILYSLCLLIQAQTDTDNICFWGRSSGSSVWLNGQFTKSGYYNSLQYYTKVQDDTCGASITPVGNVLSLFNHQGNWLISKGNGTGNPLYWAECNPTTGTPIADPTTQCDNSWIIEPDTTIDTSVHTDYGLCTDLYPLKCDSITTSFSQFHACGTNFNELIGDWAWSGNNPSFGTVYFYFHPGVFKFVCGPSYDLTCDFSQNAPYAVADAGFSALTQDGESFAKIFASDTTESRTITCHRSGTDNPTQAPTMKPTEDSQSTTEAPTAPTSTTLEPTVSTSRPTPGPSDTTTTPGPNSGSPTKGPTDAATTMEPPSLSQFTPFPTSPTTPTIASNSDTDNICFWGRSTGSSVWLNGQFTKSGYYNFPLHYYTKVQDDTCGGSIAPVGNVLSLFNEQGNWLISKGNGTGNSLYWALCNITNTITPLTDPTTQCDNLWTIAPDTTMDASVHTDYGLCTNLYPLTCDSITTSFSQTHACATNFNESIGDWAWSGYNQYGKVYFYFHPAVFKFICGPSYDLTCDLSQSTPYAVAEPGFSSLTQDGDSFTKIFSSDTTESRTITCHRSDTDDPTPTPTRKPTADSQSNTGAPTSPTTTTLEPTAFPSIPTPGPSYGSPTKGPSSPPTKAPSQPTYHVFEFTGYPISPTTPTTASNSPGRLCINHVYCFGLIIILARMCYYG